MREPRVVLFDVDGVTVNPPELYGELYARKYGKDYETLLPFYYSDDFMDTMRGKADLVDVIMVHAKEWQLTKEPVEIIEEWLEAENYVDIDMIALIAQLRDSGTKVYLATDQEEYRAQYLEEEMFGDAVDGIFASCNLGMRKKEEGFFETVLTQLQEERPELLASHIIYFDDNPDNVTAAKKVGIDAHVFTDHQTTAALLKLN